MGSIHQSEPDRTYSDPAGWERRYAAIRAARRRDDALRTIDPLAMVVCWREDGVARTNVPMGGDDPEWGYLGSGPSALATAVMTLYDAPDLRWEFKTEIVARLPHDGAMLSATAITAWIQAHEEDAA